MPESDEERAEREKREAEERDRQERERTAAVKEYTDADMQRIMTREKKEGHGAAMREIADRFGVSVDDAEKIVKEHAENEEKRKDEVTKARESADKREKDAEQREAAANVRERRALVRERLAGAVPNKKLDRATKLVLQELDEKGSFDSDDVDDQIKKLRDDLPEMFAETETNGDGKKRAPASDGGKKPPGKKTGESKTAMEEGRELAQARSKAGGSSNPFAAAKE